MENAFKLFSALLLLSLSEASPCPPGFVYNEQESCYKLFTLQATWPEAVVFCKTFGAKLSKITDQAEQTFIENYITKDFKNAHLSIDIWLGGTDLLVANEWVWTDDYRQLSYSNWVPGQPSNGGRGEDCLALVPRRGYQWNDASCTFKANFLCEVELALNPVG